MTVLNLTLFPDRAVMGQETGWIAGKGDQIAPAPAVEVSKLIALPDLGLVVGVIGGGFIGESWQNTLANIGPAKLAPFGELGDFSAVIQAVADQYPEELETHGFGTILAYWSPAEGRVVADRYEYNDGFQRERMPDGFATCPQADPEDERFSHLQAAADPEALQADPHTFHREIFGNQYRAWRAGKTWPGASLSQTLETAEVTAEGIRGPWKA